MEAAPQYPPPPPPPPPPHLRGELQHLVADCQHQEADPSPDPSPDPDLIIIIIISILGGLLTLVILTSVVCCVNKR